MDEKNNQLNVFKTVAEFSSDWLMWLTDDHSIKYISQAVKKITGYEPQDFIKDANLFKQIIHPDDKEYILKEFEDKFKNPHSCSIQFRIIHKNGSVRWIAHRCRPVFDDNNKISGRVSSNRDITNRKLAELALKEKENFLQSIIDGIQDPMHVIDRDYKVLLTNKKLLEMKNVKQEDIRGKYCYEAYQGRNEQCEQCAAKVAFESGKPHSLIKTLPLPDGTYRYFEVSAFPLMEENGDVMQVIEITRDITVREAALQDMRKMTRIIEQSAEAVAITDTDGNIEYVNSAFEKITGYSLDKAKGNNPRILKSGEHPSEFYKQIWDTITKGNIWRGQIINRKKNGTNYYEDAVIFPIKDESGKIINYAKIARDITKQKELENSIQEQEELLRTLINSTPDIICFKDGQGRWLEANEADLKLFQLDNVDYRGKKDSELAKYSEFYYDAFMTCEDTDEIAWQKGTMSRGIETIPKPDGSAKVYDVIKVPLFEEDGSRKGLVVLGRDISEMKKAEDSLKESEEKYRGISSLYRMMADNIPDLVWAKDLDGKFIFVNKAICEKLLIAKDIDEPIGKSDFFFANRERGKHPERDDWHTFGELCVNSDEITLKSKRAQRFDEYGNVQGKFLYLDVFKAPLIDGSGKIIGTVGHGRIVTKEKEIEKKLVKSEEKYRKIFEESQDVIFVTSADGKFLDINPAGLQLFGYSSLEEIQKIDIANELYKNPQDRQKYQKLLQENGYIKDYEIQLNKKDGSEVIVLETSTAIYDEEHNITAYRGIMRDITEKKKLEAQLVQAQKMESIGTLAGGVAHDFNNLLTVIKGYAEMALMDMDGGNPLHKDIMSILKAGKRAENLTSQLLAFSRKQIYKTEIVNINQVISSIDKMLRRLIGEDIHIETVLSDNLPNIKADKSQLAQIFINLVVNARDAIRAVTKSDFLKKITIETGQVVLDKSYVDEHPGSKAGKHTFFAVSDNGMGMDAETKGKIFEPFFTTKAKYKGTGLGLSMVYGIVKQNNGSVYVYSEPGEGTMFKIYWPATTEDVTPAQKDNDEEISVGNETILVVEDEEEVCRFAAESLSSLGYKVYRAANGRSALNLIKKEKLQIDLIVTDLIMPELNGKAFIEKVVKFLPTVKVIYVSGYTDNHIVHNGLLEEGVNFIHKPYSVRTLASTVRQVLDEK